jgi:DNA/RNA-binding domain of Phe-tRNA-synthetase-like protein
VRIGVDGAVFEKAPGYRRGLVVARGLTNRVVDPALEQRLLEAQDLLLERLEGEEWKAHPRVAGWLELFRSLGVNPNNRPPSLAALVKRVAKGGRLPFVNQQVALLNITSLERLVPAGGDDLHRVGDEILLRPAGGEEVYLPLGRPEAQEHPEPGEIVYVDTARGVVLCRTWCWRNSDLTKITESTTAVALNVDLLSIVPDEEALAITEHLAAELGAACGGEIEWYILTPDRPAVELDL